LARIIGKSQSTSYVQRKLRKTELNQANFNEIRHFKNNFSNILDKTITEVKGRLDHEIDTLKSEAESLKEFIETNIPLKKAELALNYNKSVRTPQKAEKFEKKLEKKARKSFKTEMKTIKKTEKSTHKLEKTYDKTVQKTAKPLLETNKTLKQSESFYHGAIGEEAVIDELTKLPDSYYIFNDITLRLPKSVRWKKYNEYVRSSQIDHIVVGPNGVFLIETKNWSNKTLQQTNYLPHKQVDRASLVFYLLSKRKFRGKLPRYNLVVMLQRTQHINYQYVYQLNLNNLNSFILGKNNRLNPQEIEKMVKWLSRFI